MSKCGVTDRDKEGELTSRQRYTGSERKDGKYPALRTGIYFLLAPEILLNLPFLEAAKDGTSKRIGTKRIREVFKLWRKVRKMRKSRFRCGFRSRVSNFICSFFLFFKNSLLPKSKASV
jgi:hypothetical protein